MASAAILIMGFSNKCRRQKEGKHNMYEQTWGERTQKMINIPESADRLDLSEKLNTTVAGAGLAWIMKVIIIENIKSK